MVNLLINYECTEKCSFCFQKEVSFDKMMSLEDFEKAINWFDRLEVFKKNRRVSILGGEPTINPKLKDMLLLLKKKGIKAVIFSNFIFNKRKISMFEEVKDIILGFVGTYNPESFYHKDERKLADENITKLKELGFDVKLSYNISKDNLDYQYIFDACKKFDMKKLRFSTALPNPNHTNNFLKVEDLKKYGTKIKEFVKEAKKRKIELDLDCTFPFCILGNDKEIIDFLSYVKGNTICKTAFDVNPDLSLYFCLPRAKSTTIKNLLDYNNLKEINDIWKLNNEEVRKRKYLFAKCKTCKYLIRNICQGGCLELKDKYSEVEN